MDKLIQIHAKRRTRIKRVILMKRGILKSENNKIKR